MLTCSILYVQAPWHFYWQWYAFPDCLTQNRFSCFSYWINESKVSMLFYRAFIWTPAHSLDQLVDLLVVFQGVPQGILSAEQPLAQAVYLRVQSWGVQHRVPSVVRWSSFSALKHTAIHTGLLLNHSYYPPVYVMNIWKKRLLYNIHKYKAYFHI